MNQGNIIAICILLIYTFILLLVLGFHIFRIIKKKKEFPDWKFEMPSIPAIIFFGLYVSCFVLLNISLFKELKENYVFVFAGSFAGAVIFWAIYLNIVLRNRLYISMFNTIKLADYMHSVYKSSPVVTITMSSELLNLNTLNRSSVFYFSFDAPVVNSIDSTEQLFVPDDSLLIHLTTRGIINWDDKSEEIKTRLKQAFEEVEKEVQIEVQKEAPEISVRNDIYFSEKIPDDYSNLVIVNGRIRDIPLIIRWPRFFLTLLGFGLHSLFHIAYLSSEQNLIIKKEATFIDNEGNCPLLEKSLNLFKEAREKFRNKGFRV